ncbi:MAG: NADPH-dependent 2,4-dienoyl-CoA reductase/sulfur reductase-like enzyme [Gammaproteobacteria bacterium]|jgi:NADPH-dependent 2,4-dienoyl-CoA reductase/sulfur reductase-like enzyme
MMSPDVLVVGAGPAGMSAALALNAAGARVRVVDEQPGPGGQIYRAIDQVYDHRPQDLPLYGPDYARGRELTRRFLETEIDFSCGTTVWDISNKNGTPGVGLVQGDVASYVYPRHIILATGAMERPTPFPGWTLPGVMTVGAAQTLFKESALMPDSQPVIVGSGPLIYLFVKQMIAAGCKPALILDTGPDSVPVSRWSDLIQATFQNFGALYKGWHWMREIKQAGVKRIADVTALSARGDQRLESIEYRLNNQSFQIKTDLLLVHDGVIPNSHLAFAADCEHRWNSVQRYWAPVINPQGLSSQPDISIVGDSAGIAGADSAACSGRVVGWNVANLLGLVGVDRCDSETMQDKQTIHRYSVLRRFLDNQYRPLEYFQTPTDMETIVCRCENVRVSDLQEVARLGCMGPNQGKAFTRCGMGPCMGRQCGNTVSQLFAQYHNRTVADIGHYRIRSPVRPLTLKQLSTLDLSLGD